jgi:hypothetical protein
MATPNFVANGTIQPSRFVTIDSTSENAVIQASANTQELIGISQEWSKLAPIPGASSEAADAGDPIKVYGLSDICLLQSTTAGWTAADRLTSDANGNGVTASGTDHYGAVALTTVSGAGLGRVQVVIGANP